MNEHSVVLRAKSFDCHNHQHFWCLGQAWDYSLHPMEPALIPCSCSCHYEEPALFPAVES